jgi:hypothetical protein
MLSACAAFAGRYDVSDFSNPSTASNVLYADSVILDISAWSIIPLLPDTLSQVNPSSVSYAPGVAAVGRDRFSFFWAQQGPMYDTLCKREYRLTATSADPQQVLKLNDSARTPMSYMHACSGADAYLATFVEKSNSNGLLRGCNDNAQMRIFGIDNLGPYSSACHVSGNTYMVVHRMGNQRIVIRKITATPSQINQAAVDTLARCSDLSTAVFTNVSCASEPGGMVITLFARNGKNYPRDLDFKICNSANFSKVDSARIATNIGDPNGFGYYDDAPVVGYATAKFAAAHWDTLGIVLDTITVISGAAYADTVRIARGRNFRSASIATNGSFLTVAWKGLLTKGPTMTIEGVRFAIVNNRIVFPAIDTFTFSDPTLPVDLAKPDLAMAMDSLGSIAISWVRGTQARQCIWARRGVRYPEGSWVSAVDSIPLSGQDSLVILAGGTIRGSRMDLIRDSIRIGPSAANFAGWNAWTALSDADALARNTAARMRYIQYKSCLVRDPGVTSLSPSLRAFNLIWNVKPRFASIDSLHVNNAAQALPADNDTLTVFARSDTIDWFFAAHDPDTGDTLWADCPWPTSSRTRLVDTNDFPGRVRLAPTLVSDTVYSCTLKVRDNHGWQAHGLTFFVRTRNDVPQPNLRTVYDQDKDGDLDTQTVGATAPIIYLKPTDSLALLSSLQDHNDPTRYAYLTLNSAKTDSVIQAGNRRTVIRGSAFTFATDTVMLRGTDPDTTRFERVFVRVNRPPAIDSIHFNTLRSLDSDSITIVPGTPMTMRAWPADPNRPAWDTLSCRFTTQTFDSTQLDSTFTFTPQRTDSTMTVIVRDLCGESDTMRFYFTYPWFEATIQNNPGYFNALDTLANREAFIIGADNRDTVMLPVINTGNDTLTVTGLRFQGSRNAWLQLAIMQNGQYAYFDSLTSAMPFAAVALPPGASTVLRVMLDPSRLAGDGLVRDTIVIRTNDPLHGVNAVPVLLEHNDLPRIMSLSFDFTAGKPYWLGKRSSAPSTTYRFPPHATVGIHFSEPMDSAAAVGQITCYSVFDSAATAGIVPITLIQAWSDNYRTLRLTPAYTAPSLYFKGLRPPPGMFMPTDSIAIRVSSNLVDKATTPAGPNCLDVNLDFLRDSGRDTAITARIDSARFYLTGISPDSAAGTIDPADTIVMTFSSPIYANTIDTNKINNRSLLVTSRYISRIDPTRQIVFDTVYTRGDSAFFVPAKKFFYGDSVECYYRGATGRDSLGYSLDVNHDGIPANLFDNASTQDDYRWFFTVATTVGSSVSPANATRDVTFDPAISLTFSNPLYPGVIDTALSDNRTLTVTSRFSNGTAFSFDSVIIGANTARFHVSGRFFPLDSIDCRYHGLLLEDTTLFSADLGATSYLTSKDTLGWHFFVKELTVSSVTPDSAGSGAPIHTPIEIRFNGPVSPALFDTTLSQVDNRSFSLRSSYSAGNRLPFSRIEFLRDNRRDSTIVRLVTTEKFFANDSVHCRFNGFATLFRYNAAECFLPDPTRTVTGEYAWFFTTENVGFYTYPNPYKPGSDSRHRAMGGIMFKNLHVFKSGMNEVIIKLFDMNTNPVFNTQDAGISIHFEEGSGTEPPQWLWNTCNARGNPVASGVYFYVVFDKNNKALEKGKVLIVR